MAALKQFPIYRKREFYRFLCPDYLIAVLNMSQTTNLNPISSHLSKLHCRTLLFEVVSMVTKYKYVFTQYKTTVFSYTRYKLL